MDFFYDEQIRRYMLQFIRVFADIKVQSPPDENGNRIQKRVPVKYADGSRMIANIMNNQSENALNVIPIMAASIKSIELAPNYRVDPHNVNLAQVSERKYDTRSGAYTNELGNRYTVESYMPVPYRVTFQLELLTSNTTSKLQIWEQIMYLFNPSIQLQQNDNPLDRSSLFTLELKDTIWSNRSLPVNQEVEHDVSAFIFETIVYINPPAKVTRQTLIKQIIANVNTVADIDKNEILDSLFTPFDPNNSYVIVTPGNYKIHVEKDKATLLNMYGNVDPIVNWENVLGSVGTITDDTRLKLKTDDNIETSSGDILASFTIDPNHANILNITIDEDTLPSTTMLPVHRIINPYTSYPGHHLPSVQIGQRYLIINENTNGEEPAIANSIPWGSSLVARNNDIIEYTSSGWVVSFNASSATGIEHVKTLFDGSMLSFKNNEWVYTYYGTYEPGYWMVENLCKK